MDVPLTTDHGVVREAIAAWSGRGTTALHDAVAWLPQLRRGATHPKSGALLLTDGVDNASILAPDAARGVVAGADLPVYVLALQGRKRRREPGVVLAYSSILRALAAATTGRYHRIGNAADVDQACREIVEDLRHQYVLSFRTRDGGPEKTRRIEVEVDPPKLEVAHRESYHGSLPGASGTNR